MPSVIVRLLLLAIALRAVFVPSVVAGEASCDSGRDSALRGEPYKAIHKWEQLALDSSAKEKLRAVMQCLQASGVAESDTSAAKWIINVAKVSSGRAVLYAGMLYASGAGVPQDFGLAREYFHHAQELHIPDAAFFLKILDEEQTQKK